jgi:hypothetical protein
MTVYINGTTGYSGPVGTIGDLTTTGNTTLGDASGDTLTLNGNTASIPNGLSFTNGNIGVGVTPSAWSGTGAKGLQVGLSLALGYSNSTGSFVGGNAYWGGSWKRVTTGGATAYLLGTDGTHVWYSTSTSSSADSAITFTQPMTLDASGQLGIGVTSPVRRLDFVDYSAARGTNSGYLLYDSTASTFYGGLEKIGTTVQLSNATANPITFSTSGSERMRIDSSGNVGIATSSPSSFGKLAIRGGITVNSGSTSLTGTSFSASDAANSTFYISHSSAVVNLVADSPLTFWGPSGSGVTERARIDSNGYFKCGPYTPSNFGFVTATTNNNIPALRAVAGSGMPDGNIAMLVDKYSGTSTTSQWFLGFTISNQTVASGVITANGASQAAFGSWSDRRLKENIVDLPPQLANIMALRPVEFDYIASEGGGHQVSFIAQEFEEIYPDAIGERSDGMKTLTGWGKTEARLVKAIQELKAEFDAYKLTHP